MLINEDSFNELDSITVYAPEIIEPKYLGDLLETLDNINGNDRKEIIHSDDTTQYQNHHHQYSFVKA